MKDGATPFRSGARGVLAHWSRYGGSLGYPSPLQSSWNLSDWLVFIGWALVKSWKLLGSLVGIEASKQSLLVAQPLWATSGNLLLVLFAHLVAGALWRRWNEREMLADIRLRGLEASFPIGLVLAMAVQLSVGAGVVLASLDALPWLFPTFGVLISIPMAFSLNHRSPASATSEAPVAGAPVPRVDQIGGILWQVGTFAAFIFGFVLLIDWLVPVEKLLGWVLPSAWVPPSKWGAALLLFLGATFFAIWRLLRRSRIHGPRSN